MRTEAARKAQHGLALRLMFEDKARFGRMRDPRRAWSPPGVRPLVGTRIERDYSYAYAAMSPHDGALVSLVLPEVNAELMSLFLVEVARRYSRTFLLVVLDGAGWHRAGAWVVTRQQAARIVTGPLPRVESCRAPVGRDPGEMVGESIVPLPTSG